MAKGMARSNYEGAIKLNKHSVEINRMLEQVTGAEKAQVIQEVSRILGSHAAQQVNSPDDIPVVMKELIEQASNGITAGMLMYHGKQGVMNVHMVQVTR